MHIKVFGKIIKEMGMANIIRLMDVVMKENLQTIKSLEKVKKYTKMDLHIKVILREIKRKDKGIFSFLQEISMKEILKIIILMGQEI